MTFPKTVVRGRVKSTGTVNKVALSTVVLQVNAVSKGTVRMIAVSTFFLRLS